MFRVDAAYALLRGEGYVEARVGSGTYVSSTLPEDFLVARNTNAPSPPSGNGLRPLSRYARHLESPSVSAGATDPLFDAVLYDFAYGRLAYDDFPHRTWQRLVARAHERSSVASLCYGSPEGEPELRAGIAAYVSRFRAVQCHPDQILVVSGSRQGLDLIARVLLEPGSLAVMEDPHWDDARLLLSAYGVRVEAVPVDDAGLKVDELPASSSGVRLVFVTPSHQYPTGTVLSLERRLKLLSWAERTSAYVVEDDYDSEYRYEGRPVESVQGLDRAGRVLYMGTFSKVMSPALRLAYLVLPEPLVPIFRKAKYLTDGHTTRFLQFAMADFIEEGHFERHLKKTRAQNDRRRQALLRAVEQHMSGLVQVSGSNAGVHLLLWLERVEPSEISAIVRRAAVHGVRVYSANPYFLSRPSRAGLVLGYASMSEGQIRAGIERLAAALKEHARQSARPS